MCIFPLTQIAINAIKGFMWKLVLCLPKNNLLLYHPACIYFFSPSFMLIISGSVEGSLSEGIKSFMYSTLIEREVLTFLRLLPSSC